MFASLYSEGTVSSSSDKLNYFPSGVLICLTISLSSFGGIPSTPGDLLSFNFHQQECGNVDGMTQLNVIQHSS